MRHRRRLEARTSNGYEAHRPISRTPCVPSSKSCQLLRLKSLINIVPFLQDQASERASLCRRVTAPTDNRSVVSESRRRTSTRLLRPRSFSSAALPTSSSELRRGPRAVGRTKVVHGCRVGSHVSESTAVLPPDRSPFRGRTGGAGNPLKIPVLSSSASVPLSLGVRDDFE